VDGYKTCGDCSMLLDINEDGEGYCAMKDLYTFRNVDEEACEYFIQKKLENNKEKSDD
jgi:hypothetical protein